jgi:hypothetical protein
VHCGDRNQHFGEAALRLEGNNDGRFASILAMSPAVCIVFQHDQFDLMRKMMPRLASTVSKIFSKYTKREKKEQEATIHDIDSRFHYKRQFTHVEDRRIRFLLRAMDEIKSHSIDRSKPSASRLNGVDLKLKEWTLNRSEMIGEVLPSDPTMHFVIRQYLHHRQDCSPPEAGPGSIGDTLADYMDSYDGSFAKYPLAKLRWIAFTPNPVRDKNSYSNEKKQMHLPSLFTHDDYHRVQQERRVVSIYSTLVWATLHGYVLVHLRVIGTEMMALEWIVYLLFMVGTVVAWAIFVAWFCSLLLAAALVKDGIRDLRLKAFNWAHEIQKNPQKRCLLDDWDTAITIPSIELADKILPALSAWSGGIGPTFVCIWAFCFLTLPLATRCVHSLS